MCVGYKPQPVEAPHLLNSFLITYPFNKHPVSGNHHTSPILSITTVDIDRLRLLTNNREEMGDVIIYNRWSQYWERLPIMYTKDTHLVVISVIDGGATKGVLAIKG